MYFYSSQTHGGLKETILSLEAKSRKVFGGSGLVMSLRGDVGLLYCYIYFVIF